MNLHDLLLNVKAVSFEELVQQTEIKTNADKERYAAYGYNIFLTDQEFRERFDLDPSCIWYTPSISQSCLFFNKETLAASSFPIEHFIYGKGLAKESFYQAIKDREREAAQKDFTGSILSLPDAMRIEYFDFLVDKFGSDIPGLYNMFFSHYCSADYGFNNMDPATLDIILSTKTEKDRTKTEKELQNLPDKLKIYRGGNTESTPYEEAYSWTLDINIANYFACRFGSGAGYIVEGEVSKQDVIDAFLTGTDEQEIFVDPKNVKIIAEIEIRGQDALGDILPSIAPIYQRYRDKMLQLDFAQESEAHGYKHEARVLLMSLTIARLLDLPEKEMHILAEAAIYHDTQRQNDGVDFIHGKTSRDYYRGSVLSPDPFVEFLCEYHCLPDEDGFREINENPVLKQNKERAERLFCVFKDADALDRVRFGLKHLDINQLRLPVSQGLGLIARMYVQQVKVEPLPIRKKKALSERIKDAKSKIVNSMDDSRIVKNIDRSQ